MSAPPDAASGAAVFEVGARSGGARAGVLRAPHGDVPTPTFMPVATVGAVRTLTARQVEATGASMLLANAYHLMLQPGAERVARLGGVHGAMGWSRPVLTDSGGFQVASLATLREVDDHGVRFRSHRDGSPHELTPERAVEIQRTLGSDVAMVLDECLALPADPEKVAAAADRSLRWAERSLRARKSERRSERESERQLLFAIAQGGADPDLRERHAARLAALGSESGDGFDGFGIGGLFMGESREATRRMTALAADALPEERPRYLMGAGLPADLVESAGLGVDLFDSVAPTRLARRGVAATKSGWVRLRRAAHRDDLSPLDDGCDCEACASHSRAWLHHLVRVGERAADILLSAHNLAFYARLMGGLRRAIRAGTYDGFRARNREVWGA